MSKFVKYNSYIIFIVSFLLCTSFVGLYPIYILDEARNAEAAREMLESGNFIVPYFNGQLRTDKPPLHYFFMILGYKLFGVNALGARFFSGIFGALTIMATYSCVKRSADIKQAIICTLVLLSSLFFVQEFHLAVPDPYLIFFVSASLFAFYVFYESNQKRWLWAMYVLIGLGIMTKGPITLVLPGIIIPTFLLFKKHLSLKYLWGLSPFVGLLLILVITVPWYYAVHIRTDGEWTTGFFLDHNISRFGSEKEGHGGLFFITPLYVILGLLPFSVFIVQSFRNAWLERNTNNFVLISFVVSTTTIIFFSISGTKLPNYPMPCYPFVAVMMATYFKKILDESKRTVYTIWSLLFLLFISIVLPIGGFIALTFEMQFFSVRYISLFLLILTVTSLIALHFYKKNSLKKAFISIALGWIFTGISLFGAIYPVLTKRSPVTLASRFLDTDSKVIVYKRFDSAFPINFKRTYEVVDSIVLLDVFLENNPNGYIITNTKKKDDLKRLSKYRLVLEQKALFEDHITRIYSKY
ncbi:MAG: glycosyltransferase family 39 protein [Bacteroidota bacterium]